jgi:hypothetical protein
MIDELAERLEDAQLGAALKTMGGKFALSQIVQESLAGAGVDGFSAWIDDHFEQTQAGLTLKDEARQAMEAFLVQVEELNDELSKDDF